MEIQNFDKKVLKTYNWDQIYISKLKCFNRLLISTPLYLTYLLFDHTLSGRRYPNSNRIRSTERAFGGNMYFISNYMIWVVISNSHIYTDIWIPSFQKKSSFIFSKKLFVPDKKKEEVICSNSKFRKNKNPDSKWIINIIVILYLYKVKTR